MIEAEWCSLEIPELGKGYQIPSKGCSPDLDGRGSARWNVSFGGVVLGEMHKIPWKSATQQDLKGNKADYKFRS